MQKVVVDTNVLVRALIKPDSSDGQVVRMVFDDVVRLGYSENLLYELIRVLSYPRLTKYNIEKENVDVFLELFIAHGLLISPHETNICRDSDDNEVIGIALAFIGEGPVHLISADKDILVLAGKVKGVTILTPQEFLKKYNKKN